MGPFFSPLLAFSLLLLTVGAAVGDDAPEPDRELNAGSTVQAALKAELDGDASLRQGLLADALQQDPKHPPARWHSGHVRIDDRWLTVEDAEFNAAAKGVVAAYSELRNLHADDFAGELLLARWCRSNGLREREKLHWANALRFDRNNMEARRGLEVSEYRGCLLTDEQIKSWKQAEQDYERALRVWNPRLRKWRREIENSPAPDQTEAWRQLTSVDDVQAVPSLEMMFGKAKSELQHKIVQVLGNIEDQVATDALIRLSLAAPDPEIRQAAAIQLSNRSWFGFVPNLLCRLETPVECQYVVNTLASGVVSEIRFRQERPSDIVSASHSSRSRVEMRTPRTASRFGKNNPWVRRDRMLAEERSRHYRRIAESMQAVQIRNAQASMRNERIYSTLRNATGQSIAYQPQDWWDWWQDYNELEATKTKPEIQLRRTKAYRTRVIVPVPKLSCFRAGTAVWTELGPVSINHVSPGDRVLSQDPDSGELAYQMVLDTTVRPPSPMLRIHVAGEQIVATLGHLFWVNGSGWRMAKELKPGDQIHGVRGGVTIDKIEEGPTCEAYNLVVADTNTYFVGRYRLLVHDNNARRVTELPLPGWEAEND